MTPSTATERSSFRPVPALLGFEAALDPVGRFHAFRRVHLIGGIALDVDHCELSARELGLAVGRLHDRLVALADRHLHRAPWAFVVEMLEGGGDLLVRRLLAARAFLRLLPGELYAEDRLRHLVGGVVRLAFVLPD